LTTSITLSRNQGIRQIFMLIVIIGKWQQVVYWQFHLYGAYVGSDDCL